MSGADYPVLTPQELAAAGQALYGPDWRRELVRSLEIPEKVLTAVETGRVPAPEHWRARLVGLAQDMALRALETASNLLSREVEAPLSAPVYAPASRYV